MKAKSIKAKMLLWTLAVVTSCSIVVSILAFHTYRRNIFKAKAYHAESIAESLALDATESILINDVPAVQTLLGNHKRTHQDIAYIFIIRDNRMLAHTFPEGVPLGLLKANAIKGENLSHLKSVTSISGEQFMDIATPIFSGKAGILRLGFSMEPLIYKMNKLKLQFGGAVLVIIIATLLLSYFYINGLIKPLEELADAVANLNKNNFNLTVDLKNHQHQEDEFGKLTSSFQRVAKHLKDFSLRLEAKNVEVNRLYYQNRTFFSIVQGLRTQRDLNQVCLFLIRHFKAILPVRKMAFLIFTTNQDAVYVISEKATRMLNEGAVAKVAARVKQIEGVNFVDKSTFPSTFLPDSFQGAYDFAVFPLRKDGQLFGVMVWVRSEQNAFEIKDLEIAELILRHTSGVILRASIQDENKVDRARQIPQMTEFCGIIGKDSRMQMVFKLIKDAAPTDATVLIQGESGTGKELVANAIHQQSLRGDKPFVVINCSVYPSSLLESELFGHEKGAFTGAVERRAGRFEQADGGTIFLDEIGEISPSAQIKLLRVLQLQRFKRVGGQEILKVDVRIIAATNKDLIQEVRKGNFREDLFYRINVIPIDLPPLRHRRNDILLLARHFQKKFAAEQGKPLQSFSPEVIRLFLDYAWPGNVRELENVVEHATVLSKGDQIEFLDLPKTILKPELGVNSKTESPQTLMDNEKILIEEALKQFKGNKARAARHLGISRSAFYDKLKKHNIIKAANDSA